MNKDFKIQLIVWRIIAIYYLIMLFSNGKWGTYSPTDVQPFPVMFYFIYLCFGENFAFMLRDTVGASILSLVFLFTYCAYFMGFFLNLTEKKILMGTWKSLDVMFYVTTMICLMDMLVCLLALTGSRYQAFSILMDYTIIAMSIWTLRTRKEQVWKKVEERARQAEERARQIEQQSENTQTEATAQ